MADLLANTTMNTKTSMLLTGEARGNDRIVLSTAEALLGNDLGAQAHVLSVASKNQPKNAELESERLDVVMLSQPPQILVKVRVKILEVLDAPWKSQDDLEQRKREMEAPKTALEQPTHKQSATDEEKESLVGFVYTPKESGASTRGQFADWTELLALQTRMRAYCKSNIYS
ncbi:hypothetical protein FI667_g961, partial [Globisporangium splendens]